MSSASAFRKSISLRLFTIDHLTKSPYPDEEFHLAFLVFVECTTGMRERCGGRGLGGRLRGKGLMKTIPCSLPLSTMKSQDFYCKWPFYADLS